MRACVCECVSVHACAYSACMTSVWGMGGGFAYACVPFCIFVVDDRKLCPKLCHTFVDFPPISNLFTQRIHQLNAARGLGKLRKKKQNATWVMHARNNEPFCSYRFHVAVCMRVRKMSGEREATTRKTFFALFCVAATSVLLLTISSSESGPAICCASPDRFAWKIDEESLYRNPMQP